MKQRGRQKECRGMDSEKEGVGGREGGQRGGGGREGERQTDRQTETGKDKDG